MQKSGQAWQRLRRPQPGLRGRAPRWRIARIAATVDLALAEAGVGAVDRVFLTGGTSLVPAVRRLFTERFGSDLVTGGDEFVSVAEGLALIGRDRGSSGR